MNKPLQKKLFLSFSIFSLVVIFVFVSLNTNNTINTAYDLQPIKTIKHKPKQDRPDLFIKYFHDIKTEFGKTNPDYTTNYQIRELLKATNQSNTIGLSKLAKTNALNWTERGPGNVSGRTRAIVVDPDDVTFNTWFVGSVGGGVWKTTNAGATWSILTENLPNLATSVLVMAASNHNIMYLGTGEGFINSDAINGSGIWKTTDRGVTWSQLANTANDNFQNVTRMVVDPNDDKIVVVSTSTKGITASSGIWKTTDGGTTWNRVYTASSRVEDLIANPMNFNTLYATVNGKGVVKSLDAGNTWFSSASGIGDVGRMEIAIAPTDTSKIYGAAEAGGLGGIAILYISVDGGANWNPTVDPNGNKDWFGVSSFAQGWFDNAIAVDPYNDTTVYVGGIDIFKLAVSSATTTIAPQLNGFEEINTTSFLALVNNQIYLGNDFAGATNIIPSDFSNVEIRFGSGLSQMAYRFTTPGGPGQPASSYTYNDYVSVPFQVWDTDHNRQLMVSFRDEQNDGTWNLLDRNNAPGGIGRDYTFFSAVTYSTTPDANIAVNAGIQYKNIFTIWPESPLGAVFNPNNLPTSTLKIKYGSVTQNNITTTVISDAYNQYSGPNNRTLVHPDHHNLTIIKTDVANKKFRLINGNDGGVTYSDDKGVTFTKTLNGYNTTQFYGVDKAPGIDRYIGGTQDNGTWVSPLGPNSASTWVHAPSGDGFEVAWRFDNTQQLLEAGSFNNGIYRSTDGGRNWTTISGLPDGPFLTKIASSKISPGLVFIVGATGSISGVTRSTDFGATWASVAVPSAAWNNTDSRSHVRISLADPSVVWAANTLFTGNTFSVSQDSGKTFTETASSSLAPNSRISGFTTDPVAKNTAYALFSIAAKPKILKTTDLGQTWTEISGFGTGSVSTNGFPDVAVFSLLVMPAPNNNIIWAGTEIGIFESRDSGATWAFANNGLPAVAIWQMRAFDGQIIVATHGRGVWTVSLNDVITGIETNTSVIPDNYSLAQNFPNPFNPTTQIKFTLPVKSSVKLIIYDALGRKVSEIVNQELPAGIQTVTWNGLNSRGVRTSSGVYFYRLTAVGGNGNKFVQSKKMILLK